MGLGRVSGLKLIYALGNIISFHIATLLHLKYEIKIMLSLRKKWQK